jgi:tubulin alpha
MTRTKHSSKRLEYASRAVITFI